MLIVALPQVSLALGASKFHATVHSTVLSATQVIVGGVVSTTFTVWLQSAWLLHASVARQVRVAVRVLPHCALVTVPRMLIVALPQVSLALGASKFHATVHSTVLSATQVIVGGVVSTTV